MPPQVPLNNELTMNIMFMIAALHGHGLEITDMQALNSYVQRLAPFNDLRQLFGQTKEALFHLRISNRTGARTEVTLFAGTQQMCIDYARSSVMNVLDAIGHPFQLAQAAYPMWQSQHYLMYVVPQQYRR